MKKNLIIAVCTMLLVCINASAQRNEFTDEMFARMANRLAKNMKLDEVATEQFTALYAEYMKARMGAAGEQAGRRGRIDVENITDEAADSLIAKNFKTQEAQLAIDREFYGKFIRIITPSQAAQIFLRRGGMMGDRQRMEGGRRGNFNGPRGDSGGQGGPDNF